MRISLKWKFTGFLAVLLLFAIGLLSYLILHGITSNQRQQLEQTMEQQAGVATDRIRQMYVSGTQVDAETFMGLQGPALARELGNVSGMRVILYNARGKETGDSLIMAEKADVRHILEFALKGKIAYEVHGDVLEYMYPVQSGRGQLGVVHFQTSVGSQYVFYHSIQRLFLIAGAAVLAISFVIGLIYMNRQANAIHRLKMATDRIRRGEYLEQPSLRRKDELGDLSSGIFEMNQAIQSNMRSLQEEQEKLLQTLEKLGQLEKRQKDFIHNISHEFKTPLTSIRAYADLLHMYPDDPALIRDAQQSIAKEADRLYELVERVLHLAAAEKYEFDHHPEEVELGVLLGDVCSRMKGKAEQFGIALHQQIQPATIIGDRNNLTHIFINLLDNAIKYNVANGSVTIANEIVGQCVEVRLRDSGVGIPEDQRELVFEPFYTLNHDRARKSGGSGLGLALVKQLTEQNHGDIRVETPAEGTGTEFIVTFPLAEGKS
ncbi:HAMP domain-containing sensor histidine kinase [Paenibacillus sp.]|jgi:signal transduction histidine kinase|uniref:sensor histidine kinase n=1 Tax=Paenibacillus sp. TaxID=58172 RepID=UPI00282A2700|nr:HAMP domain-containing sensor histidine kinase [Paenibacillus sp.]MDR0267150.1 HAMP domain-containing histidine kinase [Paenibacillus sp.]